MGIKNLDLNTSFETLGMWWIPGKSQNSCPGILKYIPGGEITLELIGFFENQKSNDKAFRRIDLIYGQVEDGTSVTLHDCFRNGLTITGEINKQNYYVNNVFIDELIDDLDHLVTREISIEFGNLGQWLAINPTKSAHVLENTKLKSLSFSFEQPEDIEFEIPSINAKASFYFGYNCNSSQVGDVNLQVCPGLLLKFDESKRVVDFYKIKYLLQVFFGLLLGEPVNLDKVRLRFSDDYCLWLTNMPISESKKKIHPLHMIMPYVAIKDNFSFMLNSWFEKEELLEPVINLFWSSFSRPDLYIQAQFLNYSQALEAYHRRFMKNEVENENIMLFLNKIKDVTIEFPDIAQRALGLLGTLKEPGLKARLDEVLEKIPLDLQESFVGDCNAFAVDVRDLRNYLTHYVKKNKKNIDEDPGKIALMTTQLEFILLFILLSEITSERINFNTAIERRYAFLENWKIKREHKE